MFSPKLPPSRIRKQEKEEKAGSTLPPQPFQGLHQGTTRRPKAKDSLGANGSLGAKDSLGAENSPGAKDTLGANDSLGPNDYLGAEGSPGAKGTFSG